MTLAMGFQRFLFCLLLLVQPLDAVVDHGCERLKASLTYSQEDAPRDLSGVLPVVVEKVNRVLDGVVDVEVEWNGADLHGIVGEHVIRCKVTRLASAVPADSDELDIFYDDEGREVTSQCFHVPFTILDTNECTLSEKHPMRHQCQEPSLCVNTIGSYECLCPRLGNLPRLPSTANDGFWAEIAAQPRNSWELSFNSTGRTTCPSHATTHGCCPRKGHTQDGSICRRNFHCPVDPCSTSKTNNCAASAQCVRHASPRDEPNYVCKCPPDLMGNGRLCRKGIDAKPEPKVMYDGVTPTELTIKNNYYCGCTKPVVDACSGFPECEGKHEVCTVTANNSPICACKPGYVMHEKYGCVDVNPPLLKLRHDPHGDQTLRLKQGDEYREYMVDIVDGNAEDYLRSLKITYSAPLPPGCLTQTGEFHVNYTIAMPWTAPSFVRVTRRVIIEDIDECSIDTSKFEASCPSLVPQCDINAGAKCVNTIGSYTCSCPKYSSGDGFVHDAYFPDLSKAPKGFQGGMSCRDTSKPVITLKGPNPKVFKTCSCGGLSGVMSGRTNNSDQDIKDGQRNLYEEDIKTMIRSSSGAELCATHSNKSPKPSDCVRAIDQNYKGVVDLTNRVVVGEPVQKSRLHWVVPYDVADLAGNDAVTVWREIVVEEVDLAEVEHRVRDEVVSEQEVIRKKAIEDAVAAEQANTRKVSRGRQTKEACPACPKCEFGSNDTCQAVTTVEVCHITDSYVYSFILWLEEIFPPSIVFLAILLSLCTGIFLVLRFILTLIFNPTVYTSRDGVIYSRPMNGGISNHPIPPSQSPRAVMTSPIQQQQQHQQYQPQQQQQQSNNGAFFSPSSQQGMPNNNSVTSPFAQAPSLSSNQPAEYLDSIYQSPQIISPRKGDSAKRYNSTFSR